MDDAKDILSMDEVHAADLGAIPFYAFALVILFIVFGSAFLGYYTRLQEYVAMGNKIPGPDQHPLVNLLVPLPPILRNHQVDSNVLFAETMLGYTYLYGYKEGIWRFWSMYRPLVLVSKPETIEAVLTSTVLLNKSPEYYFLRPWLKTGLITSSGSKWKSRRKLITSAFHFRILQDFVPVFEEQSRVLVDKLYSLKDQIVDIVPLMTLCTLDIICETAMGKSIGAQRDAYTPYIKGLHRVCKAFPHRMVRPWLWNNRVFYSTKTGRKYQESIKEMRVFAQQVIKERKEEMLQTKESVLMEEFGPENEGYFGKRKKHAFLDLLLYHHILDNSLNLEDIEEEVYAFMFAGHDTTGVGTTWALYLLGLYPEIQQKVFDEIYSIFGDDLNRPVTEDDIKEMKYLDCVLKETMRLYPSAPFVARKALRGTVIDGYEIPEKSTLMVFIYALHRREELYPNALVFDPDRFLPENCVGRHPFAYVPFSAGPRNCIGQKFAMMEEKLIVTNLLRHFRLTSMDDRDTLHLTMEMVLRSVYGLRMTFTPRNPASTQTECKGL